MIELIERLRDRAGQLDRGQARTVVTPTGELLREAADALEAAREDAERLSLWAFEARGLLAGWEDISRNNFANLAAEHVDAFDAIDQARAKGVADEA